MIFFYLKKIYHELLGVQLSALKIWTEFQVVQAFVWGHLIVEYRKAINCMRLANNALFDISNNLILYLSFLASYFLKGICLKAIKQRNKPLRMLSKRFITAWIGKFNYVKFWKLEFNRISLLIIRTIDLKFDLNHYIFTVIANVYVVSYFNYRSYSVFFMKSFMIFKADFIFLTIISGFPTKTLLSN